jgi:hypothetical protein
LRKQNSIDVQILNSLNLPEKFTFEVINFFFNLKIMGMNSESMKGQNEKERVFETVLCSPGMNEKCKINLQLSRQNILLLCSFIEQGLQVEKGETKLPIIAFMSEDCRTEISSLMNEILERGGLTQFYQKLKSL